MSICDQEAFRLGGMGVVVVVAGAVPAAKNDDGTLTISGRRAWE